MLNPAERYQNLRLLRHLQNLLIMFQSGQPEMWAHAAQKIQDWVNHEQDDYFFENAETDAGDSIYDSDEDGHGECEGEEEERDDDTSQPGDRSGWDYDDDGEGDRDGRASTSAADG